jgi:hypothetical protein
LGTLVVVEAFFGFFGTGSSREVVESCSSDGESVDVCLRLARGFDLGFLVDAMCKKKRVRVHKEHDRPTPALPGS